MRTYLCSYHFVVFVFCCYFPSVWRFPLTLLVVKVCWKLIFIAFVCLKCSYFTSILERYFHWTWNSRWTRSFLQSCSAIYHLLYCFWSPLGWTGLISLQSKGLSGVFSSTTIWKHQFFGTRPSWWSISHLYMTTGKTTALTIRTSVGKVWFLVFSTLSRFVVALTPWRVFCMALGKRPSRLESQPVRRRLCVYFSVTALRLPALALRPPCRPSQGWLFRGSSAREPGRAPASPDRVLQQTHSHCRPLSASGSWPAWPRECLWLFLARALCPRKAGLRCDSSDLWPLLTLRETFCLVTSGLWKIREKLKIFQVVWLFLEGGV